MSTRFKEYKGLDLSKINKEVLQQWEANNTFERSVTTREGNPTFVFYEGPPSANGLPGIHHVISRSLKDIICRYKTQQGFEVKRKAGWDTHGLPVELGVEKSLGITKEDIGKKISVAEYNAACRKDVMKYTDKWEDLTNKMGYWVDMDNPYVTYDSKYIETLWYLLKELYAKGLLYKGYTIQPYSPAAGTGLSTHELNQPGCYRDVKDTTCTAQFKVIKNDDSAFLFQDVDSELFFLAWTTTPWTLPSNTALAVGPGVTYQKVKTYNPYNGKPIVVVLAKDLVSAYFDPKSAGLPMEDYKPGDKKIPYQLGDEYSGKQLEGLRYEQLIPWIKPDGDAFRVILGDYVTTEDGTGMVHIAPTFGADDDRVAKMAGIAPLILIDKEGKQNPMVDKTGKLFLIKDLDSTFVKDFVDLDTYMEYSGRYVKNEFNEELSDQDVTLDVDISVMLKLQNRAFKVEKYVHSYPHCWRTDKPVLYYPLDSWFIKTTAVKERMMELNDTINWKPESTGKGRFGKWLENLVDWNLSRSRYWGTPLPIWRTEDGSVEKCIGSIEELTEEIKKSVEAGVMEKSPYGDFKAGDFSKENYDLVDLHRPYVDDIVLVSDNGEKMFREPDLIDVWFDSGAMPYAQMHYPFETEAPSNFPQGEGIAPPILPQGEGGVTAKYQTARKSMYSLLKELADDKRKNQTEAEQLLWEALRGKNLEGYKFRRQHVIDDFIVDFVCLSTKTIIEVDGGYHNKPEIKEADQLRTNILTNLGYKVIRFTNEQVIGDPEEVLKEILKTLQATASRINPQEALANSSTSPHSGGLRGAFPADFIAEGVDQTRGWFFTLHALGTMLFDSVAFKNIISNGLVLDKKGNKMSKRLGNAIDPFEVIEEFGSDPLRWYMITNAQPWDNLKFDINGVDEVKRKFFGTLYNTYSFFALYANVDGFVCSEKEIPVEERPEIDRWIISLLNSLIKEVSECYEAYEPTKAGRAIQNFVTENLSNWYVRLNRKRFWGGNYTEDKIAAYQTLYTCLETVCMLSAPIAPFFMDRLYNDLTSVSGNAAFDSVHLSSFPKHNPQRINKALEQRMLYAQSISSMVLGLRRKESLKVRQPLQKITIPILDMDFKEQVEKVKDLILAEVNVKEIDFLTDTSGVLVKKIKPNFKTLGPKYGKMMKQIAGFVNAMEQQEIATIEREEKIDARINGQTIEISLEDVEITSEDIPGWLVASEGKITVALDVNITEDLKQEGIAREFVNRIQNLRKDSGFDVTDKIILTISKNDATDRAVLNFKDYIASQTLAEEIMLVDKCNEDDAKLVEIDSGVSICICVRRNA
ncbi:Isoleucyl-tRNA synthetase [Saccharicrinis carchari]|uniref:Isoleucine--tRNA ligase n=1 Tax=Saccharicrinis carchari TaxID=1168039 RepID=A0A521EY22_SACCC|nr:isoleucine--tRNA ligase [Saccharicrinis carchari]SMO88050.1 Isoleucyl-tRNA synthetase [Saccharicrinis carchari]